VWRGDRGTIAEFLLHHSGRLRGDPHYRTALEAAGWKSEAPPSTVPGVLCDQSQDFTKGKEGAAVYVFGSGAFTISYVPPL
jgi:hypothetical protein